MLLQTLARLADHVANEVYFASGAYAERGKANADGDGESARRHLRRRCGSSRKGVR